jgi:hypothetical protein
MKPKYFIWISILVLLTMLLNACEKSQSLLIGTCIKPSFNLAFPTYATAQPEAYPIKAILPGGDWQIETTIPGNIPDHINSLTIRHDNEIWMIVSRNSEKRDTVYRYRTDTHQWTSFTAIENIATVPQTRCGELVYLIDRRSYLLITTDLFLVVLMRYPTSSGL